MKQFVLMRDGYDRRMELLKAQNIEAWRQARLPAYWIARAHFDMKNISITEWLPLPGDADGNEEKEREALEVIEYYQRQGWLKQGEA